MISRGQTPRRSGAQTPSTPSLSRPSSSLGFSKTTPSSSSRYQQSSTARANERNVFTPVRERVSRPSSSLSYSSANSSFSRPTTPSFATPAQPYMGSIKVTVRAKPSATFLRDPWFLHEDSIQHNEIGEFKFDHVFGPDSSNEQVYQDTVQNLIQQLMEGYNATVFAYGMTGSGKTYSMSGTKEEPGVIPLSIKEIFTKISDSDPSQWKYDLKVSYLEIYNERIYDLLNPSTLKTGSPELKIRDSTDYGVKVIGLVEETIRSEHELLKIIQRGDINRRTSETDFNTRSSRSHAIVQLRISTTNISLGTETISTLSLCDLAGSEKATSSNERRKEGAFINKSLLALGSVIVKLSSPQTSVGHIPYRDSKLTRLLQPALSGDSLVSILCTIQTQPAALAETVNTMRFAARAKNINLNVKKNEVDLSSDKDRMIEKLRTQLESQTKELQLLKSSKNGANNSASTVQGYYSSETVMGQADVSQVTELKEQISQLDSENRILIERLEHLKRLNEESSAERVALKSDLINDIITTLSTENQQSMIVKVEQLFKRSFSEIEEYQSYISHLENRLKTQLSSTSPKKAKSSQHIEEKMDLGIYDALMKEQEEEILQLRSELRNKDKLINALQSTKRVRDSLTHTINGNNVHGGINVTQHGDSKRETFIYNSNVGDALKPLNGEKLNAYNSKLDDVRGKV
ncbi:hypothetical protein WICPIJ_008746 [Wickerhamomyces pijperi]|uniref:Kinesin-like protein n=1 Tax=Wickerhamomyces pijperi TaxID=599730 RepID=A0A9P8PWT8_WICPI|nr:hypothetical protein WICPIJ_008746 [Wickerhamomyces pijperi]